MNQRLTDPWLPKIANRFNTKLRLFCFPYAGGSTLAFRNWPSLLPTDIEVCPVELPGRGARFHETPHSSLTDLIEALGPALLPYLDRPFALFGHSMGATIAFELSCWMRDRNALEPSQLLVSGRPAPHVRDPSPQVHQCTDRELIEHLRRYNGTPEAVLSNPELMELLLPTIRADFKLLETYTYCDRVPLGCAIKIFGGKDDETVSCDHLRAWRLQTTASSKVHFLPGDHFFIHTEEQQLLRLFSTSLKDICSRL